jgi:hypothetical protein
MGGPIFLQTSTPRDRPRSLTEVISSIQRAAAAELYGNPIPIEELTVEVSRVFIWTGFKGGGGGMLINVLLLPVNVGVLNELVPIFGGVSGTWASEMFDTVWAIGMPFFWPLGYLYFMTRSLRGCAVGPYPIGLMKRLYSGFAAGLICAELLGQIVYHAGVMLITPEAVVLRVSQWWRWLAILLKPERLVALVTYYEQFYPQWIEVIVLSLTGALALMSVPVIFYLIDRRRTARLVEWMQRYDQ